MDTDYCIYSAFFFVISMMKVSPRIFANLGVDTHDQQKKSLSDFGIPIPGNLNEHDDKDGPISIKMKQYLCARHALPKTNLTNVILNTNVSQQRQLDMVVSTITNRKDKLSNVIDYSKRAFSIQQTRKQQQWKKDDEHRLNALNFPNFPYGRDTRPPGVDLVYQNPSYEPSGRSTRTPPVLPTTIQREQTEIITLGNKTYISKLPAVVKIDELALRRYNSYCGKELQRPSMPSSDGRFRRLANVLSSARMSEGSYSSENAICKSTHQRYSSRSPLLQSAPGGRIRPRHSSKVMTVRANGTKDAKMSPTDVDFVTATVSGLRSKSDGWPVFNQ